MGMGIKMGVSVTPIKTGKSQTRNANVHSRRMAESIPGKFAGYISDVPNIELVRDDGMVFAYDEVQSMKYNAMQNFISITGGQGNFPLAEIDTGKSLDFEFESAQFRMDLFEVALNTKQEDGDFGMRESERFTAEPSYDLSSDRYGVAIFGVGRFGPLETQVVIPYECKVGSIYVRGLEESDSPSPGHFSVFITQASATSGRTVVYFDYSDVPEGSRVRISYERRVVAAAKVSQIVTQKSILCELFSHWPLYDGDHILKGIVHLHIPRMLVTQSIQFDSAYKTHSPIRIHLVSVKPDQNDKWFDLICELTDENGEIITTSDADDNIEWIE